VAPADDLTTNLALFTPTITNQPVLDVATRSVAGLDFQLAAGGANFTSIAGATLSIGASGLNATTQTSGTSTVSVTNLTVGAATETWGFFTATSPTTGTFSISSNINLNSNNLTVQSKVATGAAGKGIINLSGIISGTAGANGLILLGGSSALNTFNVTGVNTYTGTTKIQVTTVVVNSLANAGTASALGASGDIFLGGASSQAALVFSGLSGNSTTDRFLRGDTSGNYTLTNNDTNNFAVSFTNTGTFISGGSAVATLTLGGTSTGANTLSEAIGDRGAGAVSISKTGTGTWILNGANTYSGSTALASSGSTLVGIGAHAFGNTSGITMVGSTTLSLRGDVDTSFTQSTGGAAYLIVTSASGITFNADQATVAGTAVKTMSIGNISTTSTAATYQLNFTGANNTSLSVGAITGSSSSAVSTVTLSNSISGGGGLTIASFISANSSGGMTLAFTSNGNTTVTGAITPSSTALAVTKSGTGVLTLAGANTYAGTTAINAGTLVAANTSAFGSSSAVTLGSSSTTLSIGAVTASSGQKVNLPGNLTLGGGTLLLDVYADTHNTGATHTNTSDSDYVFLTGATPTISLTGTIRVLNTGGLNGGSVNIGDRFWLMDWASVSTTPAISGTPVFDLSTFTSAGVTFDTSQFLSSGYIQVSGVPEPGRALLLMGGSAAILLRRRRLARM
jgi:autotransporter-associated beta strand protein